MPDKPQEKDSQPAELVDIETIMKVAGRLFAERGYDGVSMQLIAKESGVSKTSIFYHFGCKPDLFEEVLDYKYESINTTILAAITAIGDPRKKVECIIETFFDLLLKDRTYLLLMNREIVDVAARKHRPAFAQEYSLLFSMFQNLLEAALNRPVARRTVLPVISLILGFCELAAAMHEAEVKEFETYAELRDELLEAAKLICQI